MKNLDCDTELDELRREYKRSDFGQLRSGAVTQVQFGERVAVLLGCIGEEEGIKFDHHSIGNVKANHQHGDWTYEIDNGNQVTLRYWRNSQENIEVNITNPPCVFTDEDPSSLIQALTTGVRSLRVQVAAQRYPR